MIYYVNILQTDAVASAYAIRNKSPAVALSVQAVIDCDYGNETLKKALDTPMFIMENGIPTEADYPYVAKKKNVRFKTLFAKCAREFRVC